jgi:hypothetical protein
MGRGTGGYVNVLEIGVAILVPRVTHTAADNPSPRHRRRSEVPVSTQSGYF